MKDAALEKMTVKELTDLQRRVESMIVVKQTKELLDPGVVKHFDQTTAFREAIAGVAPPSWLVDPDEAEVMEEEENQAATATQALGEAGVVSEIAGNMQQQAA